VAFFKSLAAIGIGRHDLTDVKSLDLIRIEKKLIAEQKLNGTITRNGIDQIIRVLKEHPEELAIIVGYDCLYGILTGVDADVIDTLKRHSKEQIAVMKYLVSVCFNDEIIAYINLNCNANDWNNLRVLMHYGRFLSDDITQVLKHKLTGKLEQSLSVLRKLPPHRDLKKKAECLNDKDFFVLLGETDNLYFMTYIQTLILFIKQSAEYTRHTTYFENLIERLRSFDVDNHQYSLQISYLKVSHGGQQWAVYSVLAVLFAFFCFIFVHVASKEPGYVIRTNPVTDKRFIFFNYDSVKEEQRIQMEDFVEARMRPLNYPVASWKNPIPFTHKYRNPFELDIFSTSFDEIRHGGPGINIFNGTDKECVVIAYYSQYYDFDQLKCKPITWTKAKKIYALYIPPKDSIRIDFRMDLLRFYIGKRLASFNTYQHYIYPDSADYKFSKFTPADSLLFSTAFVFDIQDDARKQQQTLTITQPSSEKYQIAWVGAYPLWQFTSFANAQLKNFPDSAYLNKPLIFDLKDPKKAQYRLGEPEINAFL
jgi:hypothetical protein